MLWGFRRAIAANETLVPAVRVTASVVDPFSLSGGVRGVDLSVDLEVNVVHFSDKHDLMWLVGPHALIKAPSLMWWRERAKDIPLLHEIKEMIGKGKRPRATEDIQSFVFVNVRGKTLLVANNPRCVSLALAGHPRMEPGSFEDETDILNWFLTELDNDIKELQEKLATPCDALSSSSPDDTEPSR